MDRFLHAATLLQSSSDTMALCAAIARTMAPFVVQDSVDEMNDGDVIVTVLPRLEMLEPDQRAALFCNMDLFALVEVFLRSDISERDLGDEIERPVFENENVTRIDEAMPQEPSSDRVKFALRAIRDLNTNETRQLVHHVKELHKDKRKLSTRVLNAIASVDLATKPSAAAKIAVTDISVLGAAETLAQNKPDGNVVHEIATVGDTMLAKALLYALHGDFWAAQHALMAEAGVSPIDDIRKHLDDMEEENRVNLLEQLLSNQPNVQHEISYRHKFSPAVAVLKGILDNDAHAQFSAEYLCRVFAHSVVEADSTICRGLIGRTLLDTYYAPTHINRALFGVPLYKTLTANPVLVQRREPLEVPEDLLAFAVDYVHVIANQRPAPTVARLNGLPDNITLKDLADAVRKRIARDETVEFQDLLPSWLAPKVKCTEETIPLSLSAYRQIVKSVFESPTMALRGVITSGEDAAVEPGMFVRNLLLYPGPNTPQLQMMGLVMAVMRTIFMDANSVLAPQDHLQLGNKTGRDFSLCMYLSLALALGPATDIDVPAAYDHRGTEETLYLLSERIYMKTPDRVTGEIHVSPLSIGTAETITLLAFATSPEFTAMDVHDSIVSMLLHPQTCKYTPPMKRDNLYSFRLFPSIVHHDSKTIEDVPGGLGLAVWEHQLPIARLVQTVLNIVHLCIVGLVRGYKPTSQEWPIVQEVIQLNHLERQLSSLPHQTNRIEIYASALRTFMDRHDQLTTELRRIAVHYMNHIAVRRTDPEFSWHNLAGALVNSIGSQCQRDANLKNAFENVQNPVELQVSDNFKKKLRKTEKKQEPPSTPTRPAAVAQAAEPGTVRRVFSAIGSFVGSRFFGQNE